jgi:hypothetical protein
VASLPRIPSAIANRHPQIDDLSNFEDSTDAEIDEIRDFLAQVKTRDAPGPDLSHKSLMYNGSASDSDEDWS